MTATYASNTDWTALQQAEDMAYFKADLCCYSPESYSPEEKKDICNGSLPARPCSTPCAPTSNSCPPMPGASSSTCSAGRGSKTPIGGGISSSARVIHCTESLRPYRNTGSTVARGQAMLDPVFISEGSSYQQSSGSYPFIAGRPRIPLS